MKRKVQADEPLRLSGATDRVFLATRGPCAVDDPILDRRLVIEKRGSATTVVWNPWREKAHRPSEFYSEHPASSIRLDESPLGVVDCAKVEQYCGGNLTPAWPATDTLLAK